MVGPTGAGGVTEDRWADAVGRAFAVRREEDGGFKIFSDMSAAVSAYVERLNEEMTDEVLDGAAAELNRHGWYRRETCHYLPEVEEAYFDGEEVDLPAPRQSADEGEGYVCDRCDNVMLPEWFEEHEADDGIGYEYAPIFDFCPCCGRKVEPFYDRYTWEVLT